MCHISNTVCPLYKEGGFSDGCANCVYLQKAKQVVIRARILLVLTALAFTIVTFSIW